VHVLFNSTCNRRDIPFLDTSENNIPLTTSSIESTLQEYLSEVSIPVQNQYDSTFLLNNLSDNIGNYEIVDNPFFSCEDFMHTMSFTSPACLSTHSRTGDLMDISEDNQRHQSVSNLIYCHLRDLI
jgi:hypothetical protein